MAMEYKNLDNAEKRIVSAVTLLINDDTSTAAVLASLAQAQALASIAASLERLVNLQDGPKEINPLITSHSRLEKRINLLNGRIEHLENVLQAHQERPQ